MPAPTYAVNEKGDTYGSALVARSPGEEPDLIQAEARNGKTGYVKHSELEAANGTAAMAGFKTPEDALAWQAANEGKDQVIAIYLNDGITVIGDFVVTSEPAKQ